jgi:RimJ/RimL family protein N-acetyltransferase
MLSRETIATVERYWASYLGCPPEAFASDQTLVLPHHGELGAYWGLYAFLRGNAAVVSVPPALLNRFDRDAVRLFAALCREKEVTTGTGLNVERVVGPAYIGYADRGTLHPASTASTRLLDLADAPAVERLRAACSGEEWEHGGSDPETVLLVGRYADGELAALASYSIWGHAIAHIAIVTNPRYRGRGYGAEAVGAIGHEALQHGLVPQYRTLESNTASMKIARRLGYHHYATTIAVRLTPIPG